MRALRLKHLVMKHWGDGSSDLPESDGDRRALGAFGRRADERRVATSGDYERGDHVIDPRTGQPARGLTSVTVIASELAIADGYATAALALGHEGMAWLATLPDVVAMGITDSQRVIKTAGFDEHAIR